MQSLRPTVREDNSDVRFCFVLNVRSGAPADPKVMLDMARQRIAEGHTKVKMPVSPSCQNHPARFDRPDFWPRVRRSWSG